VGEGSGPVPEETLIIGAFIILVVFGAAVQLRVRRKRRTRDYREFIEPPLTARGMRVVSIERPVYGDDNPFPSREIEIGRPLSNVGGTRGEYDEDRVVAFVVGDGDAGRIWARVQFEVFQFRRIRWRELPAEPVPAALRDLLETD
jgi:hypothetical protein